MSASLRAGSAGTAEASALGGGAAGGPTVLITADALALLPPEAGGFAARFHWQKKNQANTALKRSESGPLPPLPALSVSGVIKSPDVSCFIVRN